MVIGLLLFFSNTLRQRHNGCHFADIFKFIFLNGKFCILIKISLKMILKGPIYNKSSLVQVKSWCWHATSHYPKQCWPTFMTPKGITMPQWVKSTNLWGMLTQTGCLISIGFILCIPDFSAEDNHKSFISSPAQCFQQALWTYRKGLLKKSITLGLTLCSICVHLQYTNSEFN